MRDIPDHPIIQNCERTGYPDGKDPRYPHCPVCGAECEVVHKDTGGTIVGCDVCTRTVDAWGEQACFPGKEGG